MSDISVPTSVSFVVPHDAGLSEKRYDVVVEVDTSISNTDFMRDLIETRMWRKILDDIRDCIVVYVGNEDLCSRYGVLPEVIEEIAHDSPDLLFVKKDTDTGLSVVVSNFYPDQKGLWSYFLYLARREFKGALINFEVKESS